MLTKPIDEMTFNEIAREIKKDWKTPYFGAIPYINAMLQMTNVYSNYGCEDGKTIVLYFMSNAGQWRGEVARTIKAELKRLIK